MLTILINIIGLITGFFELLKLLGVKFVNKVKKTKKPAKKQTNKKGK